MYEEDYKYYKDFRKVHWTEIETWDFTELGLISNKEQINAYFNQKRFFDRLELMDMYTKKVMDKLSKYYNIHIVSIGDYANLILKEKWVKRNFPYADFIGVDINQYSDKSHIDMRTGILIDDSFKNLKTSNANIKICFGDIYSWNEECDEKMRIYNWYALGKKFRVLGVE